MRTAIWWIRRDLRLDDNQALAAALQQGEVVIPFFVLDPRLLGAAGAARVNFLYAGLRVLDGALRRRGSRLLVRRGEPVQVLSALCRESGATAVCAERDYSPYARERDRAVAAVLPLQLTAGLTIRLPDAVHKENGEPYTVFTPYSRRWLSQAPIGRSDLVEAPAQLVALPSLASEQLPEEDGLAGPFVAGEAEAQRRLAAFVEGVSPPLHQYAERRNLPEVDGTSGLSPYLRFGMISPRRVAWAAYAAREEAPHEGARGGAESWLTELIWRDFYFAILYHFPHVCRGSFHPAYDQIDWANDPEQFRAWCGGQTGYPFIDAAMRQLAHSGWMHNRARMAVASFLVKDLLIDWRWGERWFMQRLVDGDLAANNGGWQWAAGTGTDAAPYFRIFNPVAQGQKFDPSGGYIRRWVPELRGVSEKYIHEPWRMAHSEQLRARCLVGTDYPERIVDQGWARERVLAAYKAVKQP